MLQTTILTTDAAFDALEGEWDALIESSAQRVFFLRWSWTRAWWQFFAPPGSQLMLVTCRDQAGRLAGLAPLYLQTRRYFGFLRVREVAFLGTNTPLRTSEYLDILARRGAEAEVGQATAAALAAHGHWDRLWLWSVPADSTVLHHLRAALGARAAVSVCDQTHALDTTGDWADTRRNLQHDVDRAFRQAIDDAGARVERVQFPGEIEAALNDLVRLHQQRWVAKGQPGSFVYPGFEAFLRQTAQESLQRGRLGLWRLFLGDRCVAALIAFVDFGVAHYFQSGFDPDSPHSLGRLIVGLAIRDCVAADGVDAFDFMGGHDDYKRQWSSAVRETVELEYLPAGIRSAVFGALRATRERLARIRRAYRARRLPAASRESQ